MFSYVNLAFDGHLRTFQIKARILWDMIASEPRKFALSLLSHIIGLDIPRLNKQAIQEAFPIGSTLEAVKVVRVEPDRGLVLEVQDGIHGYVHVRPVVSICIRFRPDPSSSPSHNEDTSCI